MAAYWLLHLALLLLSITSQQVLAARQQQQHRHTISIQSSLQSSSMCSSPASTALPAAGSALHIVHRACLQTGDDKTVPAADHHRTAAAILRRDRYRVQSIHGRLAGGAGTTTGGDTIPARLGQAFQTFEYVVTIGVGTPARNLTVLFDTGSDLTWVQCLPCAAPGSCYHQQEPLFDPKNSSTYVAVSCAGPECRIGGEQETSCAPGGGTSCEYDVQYGDGSETQGDLAKETFTLSPRAPPATGVVFGCSHEYTSGSAFNDTTDMRVAGLLGLGVGASSILSQTRSQQGGVFSYCLPPRASSTGYLTIGGAAADQPNLSFTNLVSHSAYVVNFVGVSVNGVAVPIPAWAFSKGALVDSGTVVTHMPAAAYYPLRDEFRRHMGAYKMLPEKEQGFLDTCYDVTGLDVVTAPRVALEFDGGARIDVDPSGILYVSTADDDASQTLACLAFVATKNSAGLVIVGNMQQRAHNVVFDVDGGRIGFGPNGCS